MFLNLSYIPFLLVCVTENYVTLYYMVYMIKKMFIIWLAFGLFPRPSLTKLFLSGAKTLLEREKTSSLRMLKGSFCSVMWRWMLDVLAAIIFCQVFEKTTKELFKIRCRYVCYVKTTTHFSLAIGVKSLPV